MQLREIPLSIELGKERRSPVFVCYGQGFHQVKTALNSKLGWRLWRFPLLSSLDRKNSKILVVLENLGRWHPHRGEESGRMVTGFIHMLNALKTLQRCHLVYRFKCVIEKHIIERTHAIVDKIVSKGFEAYCLQE